METKPVPCPWCGVPPNVSVLGVVMCLNAACPAKPRVQADSVDAEAAVTLWNTCAPDRERCATMGCDGTTTVAFCKPCWELL